MSDKIELAHFYCVILEDKRRLVRPEILLDDEILSFHQFLKRFPDKFEWSDDLEGWVSKD